MALTYIVIFYRYTHEKAKAHRVFLIFGTAVVLGTVYAFLSGYGVTGQTRHGAGQTMGYCTFATAAVYYSSPMERVGLVLKHRSAAFLNIHMIFAGTLNNLAWVLYSSLVSQWIIFTPNAFCGFMGLVQIALYWIFHPSTHPLVQSETSDSTDLERGGSPSPKPTGAEYALVKSPLEPLQHS
jgi:solute carrier family 50 protein (sugar transporter)